MKLISTFILSTIWLTAIGQNLPERNWIDSEFNYTDSAGNTVKIFNSLPKGGGRYIDSGGTNYSYVIFWNRLINESDNPLELVMYFPDSLFAFFPSKDSYIRLFLPPDTMTVDKIHLFDYGFENLKPFLDKRFNTPPFIQKTIPPQSNSMFYIVVLFHKVQDSTRSSLVLNENDLFYNIRVGENATMIPCGHLLFK